MALCTCVVIQQGVRSDSGLPSGSMQQEGYGIFKYKLGVLGNMQWVIGVNLMQLGKALLFLLHLHFALPILNYNNIRSHLL